MNTSNLRLQSKIMDYIRWPLIVLVVFIHTVHGSTSQIVCSLSSDNIYHFITVLISEKLGFIAVPTFFFISGYFFFHKSPDHYSLDSYRINLKKKFKTLILPYILWNTLYLLLIWGKSLFVHRIGSTIYPYEQLILQRPIWMNYTDSLDYPLWYIRDLIYMNLLAPLVYFIVKELKIYGLVFLAITYFFQLIPSNDFVPSASTLFFVTLGAYCGIYQLDVLALTYKWRRCIGVLFSILLITVVCYYGAGWTEYAVRLYIPLGIITSLQLANFAYEYTSDALKKRFRGVYNYLLGAVFFIYAAHTVYIINWVHAALGRLNLDNGLIRLVPYFLTPICTIGVCLVIYQILRTLAPRLLSTFTGGRY